MSSIIYCGGKSGSMTLYESFLNLGFKSLHVHSYENFIAQNLHVITGFSSLNEYIINNSPSIIIDSYRNEIERTISSFFFNFNDNCRYFGFNNENISDDDIIYLINQYGILGLEDYHPLDIEYKVNLEKISLFIDEREYNIFTCKDVHGNIFIKLLFKDIEHWDKILSNFLNINIDIVKSNITDNERYNEICKKFKVSRI